jgi:hypothetical protein
MKQGFGPKHLHSEEAQAGVLVHTMIADEVAQLSFSPHNSTRLARAEIERCDLCGQDLEDEAFGRGLFFWSHGGELRWEEPGLCEECAHTVGMAALRSFARQEDES